MRGITTTPQYKTDIKQLWSEYRRAEYQIQGDLVQGEGSASIKKLEKTVWRPNGKQVNKFRRMLFWILL